MASCPALERPLIVLEEEVEQAEAMAGGKDLARSSNRALESTSVVDSYGIVGGGASGAYGRRLGAGSLAHGGGFAQGDAIALGDFDDLLVIREKTPSLRRGRQARKDEAGGPPTEPQPAPALPDLGRGGLLARGGGGEVVGEFPLARTEVEGEVSGFLAATRVRQTYTNPFAEPIEAVYVFPLPETAAVNDFLMVVGERRIRGVVRPREEAERIYARARAAGLTASLLTQERPNIFTQNVANIAPGGEVRIEVTYFHSLPQEKGWYEYVFPMVVGPRYIPGDAAPAGAAPREEVRVGGSGLAAATDRVPDADRISPPVLREGERSGHDIGLSVRIEAGVPIEELKVVTHEVEVSREGPSRARVRLAGREAIANRDFVLRFRLGAGAPRAGLVAHRGGRGGFFTLMVLPQLEPAEEEVTPRELSFLIDVSGSQGGVPLAMSKAIVTRCLEGLRRHDRFNVMYFASGNGQLWEEPRQVSRANVEEAKRFVASLEGGGGTEMLSGLARALRARRDPRYVGMVVFFTDGYVGDEEEILRLVKEERGETRVYCFGTGSSVNRYLVEGIAEHGGGTVYYALPRDEEAAERGVAHFFEMVDAPVLVDVGVEFAGLPVSDVYPSKPRDLFAGRPITLVGRYGAGARGTLTVTGRVGARPVRIPVEVTLPEREESNAALAALWARSRIGDLSDRMLASTEADRPRLVREVTEVAVEFRLVSAYTAFVAVDESRVVGDGRPLRVLVPVELPEGVSREGALGVEPVGEPVRVGSWGMVLVQSAAGDVVVG
ncbi:MAG: VWA domain-containing protein, partial [Planctomycetes bacterium]|nr:VWA domain-containing protein [Planctomycetota bacterium]